jgi:hypothetical protein
MFASAKPLRVRRIGEPVNQGARRVIYCETASEEEGYRHECCRLDVARPDFGKVVAAAGTRWSAAGLAPIFEGNSLREVGGGDCLIPYWMARYHGFLSEVEAEVSWQLNGP